MFVYMCVSVEPTGGACMQCRCSALPGCAGVDCLCLPLACVSASVRGLHHSFCSLQGGRTLLSLSAKVGLLALDIVGFMSSSRSTSTTKKRAKKLQTFKEEYNKKWSCIISSNKSPNHAIFAMRRKLLILSPNY